MSCSWKVWLQVLTTVAGWVCLMLPVAGEAADGRRTSGASIGIDIGATHVRVGVIHSGNAIVLKNAQGSELTPCYVAFTPSGHRLIGDEAKSQLTDNPRNTVFSVFPLMGREFDDEVVQDHILHMPYMMSESSNGKSTSIDVKIGDNEVSYAPEEIVAMLLRKMKDIAEKHLNKAVTGAVISVPSCFTYVQRRAMRDAAKIAGLGDAKIVNSHMATALAYYLRDEGNVPKRILVFDVGGSSVSASVMSVDNGTIRTEVHRKICGQAGDKFEQRVTDQMMKLFVKLRGPKMAQKLRQNMQAVQRIRREVEKAIRFLSSAELAFVEVDTLIDGVDFYQALTRSRFEELNMDLLRKSIDMLEHLLDENIHEVLIVGGSSCIPLVQEHIRSLLAPHVREPSVNMDPAKSAAIGAAYWADSPGVPFDTVDVYPHSLGFKSTEDRHRKTIASNESIPMEKVDELSFPINDEAENETLQIVEGENHWVVNSSAVGSASIRFPRTLAPILLATFSIDSWCVLRVTMEELKSEVTTTVAFEHGLSPQEMKRMARRLQTLDDIDRFELRRTEARDELESLAYSMKRQISRAAGFKTGDLMKAERAALDVIGWLETNQKADAEEFLMKKRQLLLAVQKFRL